MTSPPFLTLPGVLSPDDLAAVRAGLRAAPASASTVLAGSGEGRVTQARRSERLEPPEAVEALLRARLEAIRPALAAHFDRPLGALEPLQVLRYGPGDYFVAHQDGNTPLIWDRTRHRRVSVSLLLSAPGDWSGGELVFHGARGERAAAVVPAGGVVAFGAEATHEVTALTAGERVSVAGWFLCPEA